MLPSRWCCFSSHQIPKASLHTGDYSLENAEYLKMLTLSFSSASVLLVYWGQDDFWLSPVHKQAISQFYSVSYTFKMFINLDSYANQGSWKWKIFILCYLRYVAKTPTQIALIKSHPVLKKKNHNLYDVI